MKEELEVECKNAGMWVQWKGRIKENKENGTNIEQTNAFFTQHQLSEMCVRMCDGARTRLGIETTIGKGTEVGMEQRIGIIKFCHRASAACRQLLDSF